MVDLAAEAGGFLVPTELVDLVTRHLLRQAKEIMAALVFLIPMLMPQVVAVVEPVQLAVMALVEQPETAAPVLHQLFLGCP
jgi:hypothetical protein